MDNRMIYNRQQDIDLCYPDKVAVVGTGGVGFWAGLFLAMSGVRDIVLIDNDIVQTVNLNRLPLPAADVSRPKVEVLKELIVKIRPDAHVMCLAGKVIMSTLSGMDVSTVMDCTDNYRTQRELSQYCAEKGITYIRTGYDGLNSVNITSVVAEWQADESDEFYENERYRVTPSWVVPAVFVAALGVWKALFNSKFEFNGTIDGLHRSTTAT